MSTAETYYRPVRGALRLDALRFDARALQDDLARFSESDWFSRLSGTKWAEVRLIDKEVHPLLVRCTEVAKVVEAFPSRVLDMIFARIESGGRVKEHRDFSGGTPMGVGRFHIPVITHEDVEFWVNGARVVMREGEVWNLDTTYPHRVANESAITRVHLIIDVELNAAVKAMLPPPDLRDRLHDLHFAGLCVTKGAQLALRDPRALRKRVTNFVKLKFLRRSVLNETQP